MGLLPHYIGAIWCSVMIMHMLRTVELRGLTVQRERSTAMALRTAQRGALAPRDAPWSPDLELAAVLARDTTAAGHRQQHRPAAPPAPLPPVPAPPLCHMPPLSPAGPARTMAAHAHQPKPGILADAYIGEVHVAGAPSGPLHGLTAVVKDCFSTAGTHTSNGSPAWLATHPAAERHAAAVQVGEQAVGR